MPEPERPREEVSSEAREAGPQAQQGASIEQPQIDPLLGERESVSRDTESPDENLEEGMSNLEGPEVSQEGSGESPEAASETPQGDLQGGDREPGKPKGKAEGLAAILVLITEKFDQFRNFIAKTLAPSFRSYEDAGFMTAILNVLRSSFFIEKERIVFYEKLLEHSIQVVDAATPNATDFIAIYNRRVKKKGVNMDFEEFFDSTVKKLGPSRSPTMAKFLSAANACDLPPEQMAQVPQQQPQQQPQQPQQNPNPQQPAAPANNS